MSRVNTIYSNMNKHKCDLLIIVKIAPINSGIVYS